MENTVEKPVKRLDPTTTKAYKLAVITVNLMEHGFEVYLPRTRRGNSFDLVIYKDGDYHSIKLAVPGVKQQWIRCRCLTGLRIR
jgi:hypothetical protein